jgi:hypothetical protein
VVTDVSEETAALGFRLKFYKMCIYRNLTLSTDAGYAGKQYYKNKQVLK